MSQTTVAERIFDFGPGAQFPGYEGDLQGVNFFENLAILYKTDPSEFKFQEMHIFCFLI